MQGLPCKKSKCTKCMNGYGGVTSSTCQLGKKSRTQRRARTQTALLRTQKAENAIEINMDTLVNGNGRHRFSCSSLENYIPWPTDSLLRALKFGVSNSGVHRAVPCHYFLAILIQKNKQSYYKCFSKTTDKFFFYLDQFFHFLKFLKKKKTHCKKWNTYVCIYATIDRHIYCQTDTWKPIMNKILTDLGVGCVKWQVQDNMIFLLSGL